MKKKKKGQNISPSSTTDDYYWTRTIKQARFHTCKSILIDFVLQKWKLTKTHFTKPQENITYWAVQWSWFAWENARCNLSCKKLQEVAASLLGQFLSRCCFTLCITMEVQPFLAKQYKCHHRCSCKNYQGKGVEGGEKESLCCFFADQNIASWWGKNAFWGIL